jgi:hypothetical protein
MKRGAVMQRTSSHTRSISRRCANSSVVHKLRTLTVARQDDLSRWAPRCGLCYVSSSLHTQIAASLTELIKFVIVVLPAASPPSKNPDTLAEYVTP